MSIEKWHPIKELDNIRRDFDRVWEEMFPVSRRTFLDMPFVRSAARTGEAVPAIDLIDEEKELILKANMPGVKKEDLDVSLQEDTLHIKGESHEKVEKKDEDFFYSERSTASYSRSILLPCKVNEDKIKASLKDGVLTINMPKSEEHKAKRTKVDVS